MDNPADFQLPELVRRAGFTSLIAFAHLPIGARFFWAIRKGEEPTVDHETKMVKVQTLGTGGWIAEAEVGRYEPYLQHSACVWMCTGETPVSPTEYAALLVKARAWLEKWRDLALPSSGYVYFHQGEATGWTCELREPERYAPGVVFVNLTEPKIWVTVGGDVECGAREFVEQQTAEVWV